MGHAGLNCAMGVCWVLNIWLGGDAHIAAVRGAGKRTSPSAHLVGDDDQIAYESTLTPTLSL
jgi:hypothetical protein